MNTVLIHRTQKKLNQNKVSETIPKQIEEPM